MKRSLVAANTLSPARPGFARFGSRFRWGHSPAGRLSLLLGVLLLVGATVRAGEVSLVATGAVWRYWDAGMEPANWRAPAFDDSVWSSGPAKLGFGEGNEATRLNPEIAVGGRLITAYFRHTFVLGPDPGYTNLLLRLLRDDGAAVYLNGTEVFRSNLPPGPVSYLTLATAAVGGAEEGMFVSAPVSPGLLVAGENVVAVEVHQVAIGSSDLSFDFELIGQAGDVPPPAATQAHERWARRYDSTANGTDWPTAIATDPAGNVYVAGADTGSYYGNHDFVTIKYDAAGNRVWTARYNGPSDFYDFARALVVDDAGNVYVTGFSLGSDRQYDIATIKYDAHGNQLWLARYDGPKHENDYPVGIGLDAAGNVYVGGHTDFYNVPEYVMLKYNAAGVPQWTNTYPQILTGGHYANAMALDAAGNSYLAGVSASEGSPTDFTTVKFNAAGTREWVARYRSPARRGDYAEQVAVDPGGNVYVTGSSYVADQDQVITTVKYDPAGRERWVVKFKGPQPGYHNTTALKVNSAGEAYISTTLPGEFVFPFGYETHSALLKYDAGGNLLWFARYQANAWPGDFNSDLAIDSLGHAYVSTTARFQATSNDLATIKYDPHGNLVWLARYDGPAHASDSQPLVALDPAGNVLVTGRSEGAGTQLDIAIVKYAETNVPGAPVILSAPQSLLALRGSNVVFRVAAAGDALSYQWRLNGKPLPGATGDSLALANVQPTNNGDYAVEVRNAAGWTASAEARLKVTLPPRALAYPAEQRVIAGARVALFGQGNGDEPLSYQWLKDGLPLAGATDAHLVLENVQRHQAGDYRLVVRNPVGVVTSEVARVIVLAEVAQSWVVRYTNHASEGANAAALKLDAAGNVYVGGTADGAGTGMDFITVKYAPTGQQLWASRHSNLGFANGWVYGDALADLAVDAAGNVHVTGTGRDQSDYTTIKYGGHGNQLWIARYAHPGGDPMNSAAAAVVADAAGNVYVTGHSVGDPETGTDIATVKYDGEGRQLWAARFTGENSRSDFGFFIHVDAAGNVYVGGESYLDGSASEFVVLKYAADGQRLWVGRHRWPDSESNRPAGMAVDAHGNTYLVGTADFASGSNPDFSLVKFGPDGQGLWARRYDGPAHGYDFAGDLALDGHGHVVVTGTSQGSFDYDDDPVHDLLTLKYDANGNRLWVARQWAQGANGYAQVAVDAAGNAYVTGHSFDPATGWDYLTLKYDPAGHRVWLARFDHSLLAEPWLHSDTPADIAVDGAGNVFVTGTSDQDIATVKYTQASVPGAPRIVSAPLSQPAHVGTTVTLSATVVGEAPLEFQWRHNGEVLPEATGPALVLKEFQEWQTGEYSVEVANALGSTASPVALLQLGGPASPFVQRRIESLTVELAAAPPAAVNAYAVEEQLPAGWTASAVSHGGGFDGQTGKVKFGPFFDATARTLGYTVQPPPGAQGVFPVSGVASADGANTAVGGDDRFVLRGPHPADGSPSDWTLTIAEVTAYGAAWRTGGTWPLPPLPIPIDYVSRAAALWRGGECYRWDPEVFTAPLGWVSCASEGAVEPAESLAVTGSSATRTLPGVFVPGETLIVSIAVAPAAAVGGYAVEDQPPAGWSVTGISDGGAFDAVNRRVKWGPFLDAAPRTVTYAVQAPAAAAGPVSFAGVASFDGASLGVAGARELREPGRLRVEARGPAGEFKLSLSGLPGTRYWIEASSDLRVWSRLAGITNEAAVVNFSDPEAAGWSHRFYRAVPQP